MLFDERVHVLKLHLPFHESDHVLSQALNLYVGGECLEDQAALQHDEGVLRMLGACRLPDPTTAGDFLRRFADDLVRADSDFDRRDVREACEAEGVWFAFVAREATNRISWAESVEESEGQESMFEFYRDRYGVTNLPTSLVGPGGDRRHLPTLRPGERDRADGQRCGAVADARGRVRGQQRRARDRPPGLESR